MRRDETGYKTVPPYTIAVFLGKNPRFLNRQKTGFSKKYRYPGTGKVLPVTL